jgi:Holliday junction resolvasome RuvABC endonuclease subunit
MIICGIDPGLSGGLAFFDNETKTIHAEKAPIFTLKTKTKTKRFLDMWTLMALLEDHDPDHVFIEKQQPMPRQGLVSTFATGMGYGVYLGLLVSGGFKYTEVQPRIWKKDLGCTSDKDQSRMRASELMPNGSYLWRQKNQDGLAEASLIAYWGIYKSISQYRET